MSLIFMPFLFPDLHLIYFIDQIKSLEGQATLARLGKPVLLLLGIGWSSAAGVAASASAESSRSFLQLVLP